MKEAKVCSKCREKKELSEFATDNAALSGKKAYCRKCA